MVYCRFGKQKSDSKEMCQPQGWCNIHVHTYDGEVINVHCSLPYRQYLWNLLGFCVRHWLNQLHSMNIHASLLQPQFPCNWLMAGRKLKTHTHRLDILLALLKITPTVPGDAFRQWQREIIREFAVMANNKLELIMSSILLKRSHLSKAQAWAHPFIVLIVLELPQQIKCVHGGNSIWNAGKQLCKQSIARMPVAHSPMQKLDVPQTHGSCTRHKRHRRGARDAGEEGPVG